MNKIRTVGLLSLLIMSSLLFTAEPSTGKVTLQANDGAEYKIPADVAKLSNAIAMLTTHIAKDQPIKLANIDGESLKTVIALMEIALKYQNEPSKQRIDGISNEMLQLFSDQDLDAWTTLEQYIDYLDIDLLKAPWANSLIQVIHAQHKEDSESIEAIILSLGVPEICESLLAKYWYLNYGKDKKFILPEHDYGFSIEELRAYKKIPTITQGWYDTRLDLSDLRINDLTGLKDIESINNLLTLLLYNNQITAIQPGTFNGLNNLKWLHLDNNQITTIQPGTFNGLNNLKELLLYNNQITAIQPGAFNGLNKLQRLELGTNKITTIQPGAFNDLNLLQTLDLDHNEIKTIQPGAFNGLNKLEWLKLNNNQITKLPKNIFAGLPANCVINLDPGVTFEE